MRKSLIMFTILIFACSCCSFVGFGKAIKGNGIIKTEERTLPKFDGISVAGSYDVRVKCGEEQKVTVSCDDNLLPHVITEVKDGKLDIYNKHSISPIAGMELTISVENLKSFSITGSAEVSVNGISGESFIVDIAGSGEAVLTGKVVKFELDIAGSGEISAKDLIAENVGIDVSGSGEAVIFVTQKLHVEIAGSGEVKYYGKPAEVTKDIAGSGSIINME
jgi:hypothetical protein